MNEGIVSYAQNFEDVILWRALAHVGVGNYVDVGAQSAYEDSVSRAFHEHGWKGVHVEPMPLYADQLRKERVGDVIMQVMVGAEQGMGELFAMSGTGLSTSREDLAENYQREGREVSRVVVPVVTLDTVLDNVEGEIHWLKIDVEGAELQVLQGWHGNRRPWVLVIESTRPMSQEQNYEEWDALVVGKGYRFVYFDGLNRFYVSDAHPELVSAFGAGPNVFDRFSLSGTATSTFSAKLNHDLAVANEECRRIAAEYAQAREDHARGREEKAAVERVLLQQRLDASERENGLLAEQASVLLLANNLQEQLSEVKRLSAEAVAAAIITVQEERDAALARAAHLHADLAIIHRSTSWTVTAPLRALARLMRAALKLPVNLSRRAARGIATIKPSCKRMVGAVMRRAARSTTLKRIARRLLVTMPSLDTRLRRLHGAMLRGPVIAPAASNAGNVESAALLVMLSEPLPEGISAQARQSLLRLRHAAVGAKA